ncbi:MAG: nuclear transport factor 2 family protein [Desulfobacterales bacterium]
MQVAGDVAYEIGIEHGQFKHAGQKVTIKQRVTNIYRRESGVWKIFHHHTDVSPAMLDVIGHAQAET